MGNKPTQKETPFLSALKEYASSDVSPFDVPGHHMGNIENAATELFGHQTYRCDVNAPIGLDNLAKPTGVIRQSEDLLADACGADEAFFLINGTSSGIIAMIMTAVKANEKIILPRNVHKSIVNGLILSGAVPVYVMPEIDGTLEIANQPSVADFKKAIMKNPSAKAVFVINPTYFGAVSDLKAIVALAHAHHMAVLVDEAHGAHYYFRSSGAPLSAMEAGADMSASSFHKTVGSLTQSSVLLLKNGFFSREDVQKTLNILNTTSPSHLLLGSLDAARAFMASKEGKKAMDATYSLVKYARNQIEGIDGFHIISKEHFLAHGCYDYDISKLVIEVDHLDINGFELFALLKNKYDIQMELSETYVVMGVFAIGTKKEHVDNLICALKDISKDHYRPEVTYPDHHFDSSFPFMLLRPRAAFHAPGKVVPVDECDGAISKEQVMMYPPGIPLIVPGEVWSKELIERVRHYEKTGIKLLSSYEKGYEIVDLVAWKRFAVYEKRLKDYFQNRMTTPNSDGYRLPFEGKKHEATFVLLPYRSDTWRNRAIPAVSEFRDVILAIAEHEQVYVGIHPSFYKKLLPEFEGLSNVTTIPLRYNDAWARDNMPLFLTNGVSTRTVDFRFNAWGGEFDGLYANYADDDRLGANISRKFKLSSYYHPSFVLEGGSIAVDGEGTLITTEACLLSKGRNPTYSKPEIEELLRDYLSIEKVIWVPHGIYEDETDEHIDNMVAIIKPGEVVMAYTDDKTDPQYVFCQQTYKALSSAKDAKGRKLKIHFLPLPNPAICMSESEAKGLNNGRGTKVKRLAGRRLAASYVNYYQGSDFIILPAFGVKEDAEALKIMTSLYPDKIIHQINSKEILLGGGNIHCITMQMPSLED